MRFLLLSIMVLLAACSIQAWNEKMSTPQERAAAASVISLLRMKDVNGLSAMADDTLRPELTTEAVAKLAAMTPPSGQPTLQTVQVNSAVTDGGTRTMKAFAYELGAGDRWALLEVVLETSSTPARLKGLHVQPWRVQPTTASAFTLTGKSPAHYFWLVAMALAVITSVAAAIVAIRSPRFRKLRWLWVIGALVSFVTFSINWTTGQIGVMPISFLLLGASGLRGGPFSPWVLSFAIPVVAIIILVRATRPGPEAPDLATTFSGE